MIDTTGKCSACGQTVGINTIHTCSPQVTAPKIVRKVDAISGDTLAVWINGDDRLMGWWEFEGAPTAEEEIEKTLVYAGWSLTPDDARKLDTTLAALRAELEGGRG